jgi:GNAT superfamily N-acetyltransferase
MKIRQLSKSDYTRWRELWDQYLVFYKHELSESQTQLTFERLTAAEPLIHGLVLEVDGQLVGFAHSSFTSSTWAETKDLYLEDLFVDPDHRGKGYGRALIEATAEFAKAHGSRKLYWQTHKDNETAQNLYRALATKSEFVIYEKEI